MPVLVSLRAGWVDRVFLSADGNLDGATLLASVTRAGDLAGGASYNQSAPVVVPAIADGSYRLVVVTDATGVVFEGAAENDNVASTSIQVGHADLVPSIASAPSAATGGTAITVEYDVANQGTAPARASWRDRLFLSTDAALSANDTPSASGFTTDPWRTRPGYHDAFTATLPVNISGGRFLLVVTDAEGEVPEQGSEGNNLASAAIAVALAPYADLEVSGVTAPAQTIADPASVEIGWTVTNVGTGVGATTSWVDRVIASPNAVAGDADDTVLAEFPHTGALTKDSHYTRNETILLPPAFEGRYHLFVLTDATRRCSRTARRRTTPRAAPDALRRDADPLRRPGIHVARRPGRRRSRAIPLR